MSTFEQTEILIKERIPDLENETNGQYMEILRDKFLALSITITKNNTLNIFYHLQFLI